MLRSKRVHFTLQHPGLLLQRAISSGSKQIQDQRLFAFDYPQSFSFYFNWLRTGTKTQLQQYEKDVLSHINLPPAIEVTSSNVSGLHQLKFVNRDAAIKTPLVLVHGFAASSLFYYRNFKRLTQKFETIYSVDLPDVALSDKKYFRNPGEIKYKIDLKPLSQTVSQYSIEQDQDRNKKILGKVKDYYTDSLEAWRETNNLHGFNLVGHSFGGYLSFYYSLKYPHNVKKLALVSPVGVEKNIYSVNNTSTKGITSVDPTLPNFYRPNFVPDMLYTHAFRILRAAGPFGVKLVSNYLGHRYARGSSEITDIQNLMKTTTVLFFQNNNSHRNLKTLLNAGMLARDPILDHIRALNDNINVNFLYGMHDWMNKPAGLGAVSELGPVRGKFTLIESAGHNVFLDNPIGFNDEIIKYFS